MIKNGRKQFMILEKLGFKVQISQANSAIVHDSKNLIQLAHPRIGILNVPHAEIKKIEKTGSEMALLEFARNVIQDYKSDTNRELGKIILAIAEAEEC